ncbi:MAG TPA: aspartate--tRNA ligase [Longimicrobiales bacterium]|nr:aspartate--tRNA ligase [Longimicrobiales bacterium]
MSRVEIERTALRDRMVGGLRSQDEDTGIRLTGWVHRRRDLGGLVFVDLRDRSGLVQVSFGPDWTAPESLALAHELGHEDVIFVEGTVTARPQSARNADMATGEVELRAATLRRLASAVTPAIPVYRSADDELPAEELRLQHRVLDLRRGELQRNLTLRHALVLAARNYFDGLGFLEIETPMLTKATPEGARDYVVPSRVHKGEFYALPQSPQLYKQVLMIAGFDRYFQIARCFRDEDLRADRQPEFTQIDIEASFIAPEDIYKLTEGLIAALFRVAGLAVPDRFDRMTYADAMESYGTDRPDLRYELKIFDATEIVRGADFGITKSAIEAGGRVRGLRIPGGASFSRKQVDELEAIAKSAGVAGLLRTKRVSGALDGPLAKHLPAGAADRLAIEEGDLCLLAAAPDATANPALDRVRQEVAIRLGLGNGANAFVWVTDFPLFTRDAATGALGSVHHPFTSPHPDDLAKVESAPGDVRALAYDLVLNGTELGGGSMRISDPRIQSRVFTALGISEADAQTRFGFLLEALRSGAPPHGGIAFGFDRIAMMLAGAQSLRDVIAFPKTTAARALFEGAPSPVSDEDLQDLHIRKQ